MLKKLFIYLITAVIAVTTFSGAVIPVSALQLSAYSAIVIEASTGRVVYEKDADTRRPMASTTKIMTALVALESGDMSQTVSVAGEAVGIEGSSVYLETGDNLSLGDLVWALLLESANDAAAAIAIEVAGSVEEFAVMMNNKAAELGLENTNFTNPHGLDNENHYTTARDLAKLSAYALQNPRFREIVSTYRHSISFSGETRYLLNHNKMLKLYDGAIGVKTGYTKRSGRCLVSAAERNGVEFVAVTLNASDDWRDHCEMLNKGFEMFESREIIKPGESVFISPCIGSEKQDITIKNRQGLTVSVPKETTEITRIIELPHYFWADICEGDIVGRIIFEADGYVLGEVPLYAEETAPRIQYKKGIIERIFG